MSQIENLNFKKALAFTLLQEGVRGNNTGYSNHPNDRGGETNYGITLASYNTYRRLKKLSIRSVRFIEKAEVDEIYFLHYWHPSGCELLPQNLALCHFDWAVNHGTHGAICTLQRVFGTTPDGIIGEKTKQAINRELAEHGEKSLFYAYCMVRENWYRNHAANHPSQRVFLKGWLNRIVAVRQAIT